MPALRRSTVRRCPAVPPVPNFRFLTDCVSSNGGDIGAMRAAATAVSRRRFLRYVDRGHLAEMERNLGYETRRNEGLVMADDWHVSYHLSTFAGAPCAYFAWSGIEHVYVVGAETSVTLAYGARRRAGGVSRAVWADAAQVQP